MDVLKKLFIVLFLIINSLASAKTYYVSTIGKDANPGTIDQPWATWGMAFNTATAGDTVYFRGGVYYTTTGQINLRGPNGKKDNPICFFNYPGEVPILDGINKTVPSHGIQFQGANNIHFKGLIVRNNFQLIPNYQDCSGIAIALSNNITIENCKAYNNGRRGFYFFDVDTALFLNCDGYNNCDSISTSYIGGAGDGFLINDNNTIEDKLSYTVLKNCRAWHNSDDGYDVETEGYLEMDNCLAFNNGYLDGDGTGFKLNLTIDYSTPFVRRKLINSISAFNMFSGITTNDNKNLTSWMTIYNNISYHNGYHGGVNPSYGFVIYNTSGSDEDELERIFKNNVSYGNEDGAIFVASNALYTDSFNSWDHSPAVIVTDADFISIDSTGLTGPRQADGSLPNSDFLRLAPGSDLIDAGADIGLPYSGSAPDLGCYEYSTTFSNSIPVTSITVSGTGGATAITTANGTLQLGAMVLPADATNKTVTWSVSGGTGNASISPTGLLTAIDNGTAIVRATANDGSGVYGTFVITISNQNNETIINAPPIIVVNYETSSYSGFVSEINASDSYDINKDNLTFTWITPKNVPVSSNSGSTIKYLNPIVSSSQTVEFTLNISDGKAIQSKVIPIEILPYKPELEVAQISSIEASSFQNPNYPYNVLDGNIGTIWSASGDNQWLIVKLKEPFDVKHVELAFQPGQKKESYFDILGSLDKINWEPILIKSSSCAFSGDLQVFDFPISKTEKEYNYIKLIGLGNSTDNWNFISELKIFGYRHRNSPAYEILPIMIYPNPAKEYISIRIDDSNLNPDFIKLIDLSGVIHLQEKLNPDLKEYEVPIYLKNGAYIVQLGSGKLTLFSHKLIVNN
jgi:parallel beta-helix repeat protein